MKRKVCLVLCILNGLHNIYAYYTVPQLSSRPWASLLLLLLSRFSRVRLCATPETPAHQAPPSLGVSRQEHWSGLPFLSPMHESEKWKWSCSVVSDSLRPHGLQPTRLLHPWDFQARVLEWGAIAFSAIWGNGYVNYLDLDNHSALHTYIKPSHFKLTQLYLLLNP